LSIVGILIALVCPQPTMDEGKQGQSIYQRLTNRQTRAINIHVPTIDEQTDKGNQYTYDGLTDRKGQSIYLRWTKRQTREIDIPTMDE
jgi:hypothetical protein